MATTLRVVAARVSSGRRAAAVVAVGKSLRLGNYTSNSDWNKRDVRAACIFTSDPRQHAPTPEVEKMMGARDPKRGEIHSDFGNNLAGLGMADTEHIIKPPEKIDDITGLKNKKCVPCEGKNAKKLTEEEADKMQKQAGSGWQIKKNEKGEQFLHMSIAVKNFSKGLELFQRVGKIAEEEGHHPDLHLESWNKVSIVMSTHSVGGLTENDFIMAAKINDIDISDLKKKAKQKFWA